MCKPIARHLPLSTNFKVRARFKLFPLSAVKIFPSCDQNDLYLHYTFPHRFACADAASEADEESEKLHHNFLAGEIELLQFIQQYRKQRILYHRRSLIRMAALSSMTTPG